VEQVACIAARPLTAWSIPTILADFLHDSSKLVEVAPNLPLVAVHKAILYHFFMHTGEGQKLRGSFSRIDAVTSFLLEEKK
jgi:hypothetical protein